MNEDEVMQLQDIFFEIAPFDYDLVVTEEKSAYLLGLCVYADKMCYILGPQSYEQGLVTMLHEVAHARIQHETHSDTWEKEFVFLLKQFKIRPEALTERHILGPNVREYIHANL